MRRAGRTTSVAQGVAVVRCADDRPAEIGSMLVDEQLTRVARVVDVIGPVSQPYLVVTPVEGDDPDGLLGKTLYLR